MSRIKIDVWSDVVCPFCYLGKVKLERAIHKLDMIHQTEVEWHSFQLDPEFPKGTAQPSTDYLKLRKGMSVVQVQEAQQRLTDQGANYGIHFCFERAVNFNTFDVHRLLHWSKVFKKGNELKATLLKAHFTDGIDLSKSENLINLMESIGLDSQVARQVITSHSYTKEVEQDRAYSQ